MNIFFSILIVIAAFFFMEFTAWFTHKYVMHGFGWILHKDHHIRDGRKFEYNDLYALIFAIPSIVFIILGINRSASVFLSLGIGIALYGLAYFLFHDVYVHQRVKIKRIYNRYLRAILKAHEDHHKPHTHYNYGFLIAPWRYYRDEYFPRGKTDQPR